MCAFVDNLDGHGEHGTGETQLAQLRPGKASPWSKTDHIQTLDAALAQLPEAERAQVLVRADSGACSKAFLHHITDAGLEFSIGFPAHETVNHAVEAIPAQAWRAAVDADGRDRDGAQIADLTGWMPTPARDTRPGPHDWSAGMRIIARRERPHPGAQLHLTDIDGWRITCFATNTRGPGWTLAALETRHRLRARAEDRIRGLKDTGLRNLPYHDYHLTRSGWKSSPSPPTCSLGPKPWPGPSANPPAGGNPTAPAARPGRGRAHHPHRPATTPTPTPPLALEPTHRHRLDRTPNPLTSPASPDQPTRRNRRTQRRNTHTPHHQHNPNTPRPSSDQPPRKRSTLGPRPGS